MTKNILIVLTSHDKLGETDKKTGYWKEEFATPYYALLDAGVAITLATPLGGTAPVDPGSESEQYASASTRRLDQDKATQEALNSTVRLDTVNTEDFDAVFYPGGHGPLWDLALDKTSIELIQSFYKSDKPVATVCHASAALINVKKSDGSPLVSGKKVTGFTNNEEAAVGLTEIVPFLLEDELAEAGATFINGGDFAPHAVEDGFLITGQNPMSSELVANALIKKLG